MTIKLEPQTIKVYLKWLKKPTSLYMACICMGIDSRGREAVVEVQLPALPLSDMPTKKNKNGLKAA